MLHNMARGSSGRIVLEIDPIEKQLLHEAVRKDGLSLKDWFLAKTGEYLSERNGAESPRVLETDTTKPSEAVSIATVSYRQRKKRVENK